MALHWQCAACDDDPLTPELYQYLYDKWDSVNEQIWYRYAAI